MLRKLHVMELSKLQELILAGEEQPFSCGNLGGRELPQVDMRQIVTC